jgi:hypothetical protein
MKWASLLVGALACALPLVTGCDKFLLSANLALSAADAIGSVRTVDGPPQTVAVSLAAILKTRGFAATVENYGDEVVVESKTSNGLAFALMLRRAPAENGRERTQVTMQWMGSTTDDTAHVQIMAEIDKQPGAKK